MHFESLSVPAVAGLRRRLRSLNDDVASLLRVALHPRARVMLTAARIDLSAAERCVDSDPDAMERENLDTWLSLIKARLQLVGGAITQFGANAVPASANDGSCSDAGVRLFQPPSLQALRVRHAIACVRAARLWADRRRPANETLAETIRRLQDIGRQLTSENLDDRPAVIQLLDSSLEAAERQLEVEGRPEGLQVRTEGRQLRASSQPRRARSA